MCVLWNENTDAPKDFLKTDTAGNVLFCFILNSVIFVCVCLGCLYFLQ